VRNVQLLIDKINTYFIESEKVNPNAIVCCTGHRIKGLEYKRCIVLRPDLCPHPKAEGEEELAQEENIWYVMLTRAIEEMWVCYDDKPE
jgi:superfamily I DNA/RNA helicase